MKTPVRRGRRPKNPVPRPFRGPEGPGEFGKRVRQLREAARMQKKELARLSDISDSYVTRIENEGAVPQDEIVVRIARALDCNEAELVMLALRDKAPPETRAYYRPEQISDFLAGVMPGAKDLKGENLIPVLNAAACGQFIEANDLDMPAGIADYYHPMPTKDPNAFFVKAKGDSMIGGRIDDGDLLLVEPNRRAENGDIVLARVNGEVTVKRYYKRERQIILQPMNPAYDPIFLNDKSGDVRIYRISRIVITL